MGSSHLLFKHRFPARRRRGPISPIGNRFPTNSHRFPFLETRNVLGFIDSHSRKRFHPFPPATLLVAAREEMGDDWVRTNYAASGKNTRCSFPCGFTLTR